MPLVDYEGQTFVAYLDISGFKLLMKKESGFQEIGLFSLLPLVRLFSAIHTVLTIVLHSSKVQSKTATSIK